MTAQLIRNLKLNVPSTRRSHNVFLSIRQLLEDEDTTLEAKGRDLVENGRDQNEIQNNKRDQNEV